MKGKDETESVFVDLRLEFELYKQSILKFVSSLQGNSNLAVGAFNLNRAGFLNQSKIQYTEINSRLPLLFSLFTNRLNDFAVYKCLLLYLYFISTLVGYSLINAYFI